MYAEWWPNDAIQWDHFLWMENSIPNKLSITSYSKPLSYTQGKQCTCPLLLMLGLLLLILLLKCYCYSWQQANASQAYDTFKFQLETDEIVVEYVVLLWILRDLVLYLFSVALFLWANFRTLLYSWDSYQLVDSKIAFLPCLSGTLGTQYWSYYLGFCMLSYNFGEFCLLLNYNLNTLWHPNFACIL